MLSTKFSSWLLVNKSTIDDKIKKFQKALADATEESVETMMTNTDINNARIMFKELEKKDKDAYLALVSLVVPMTTLPKTPVREKGTREKGTRVPVQRWSLSKKNKDEFDRIYSKEIRNKPDHVYSFAKSRFKPSTAMKGFTTIEFHYNDRSFPVGLEPWDNEAYHGRSKSMTQDTQEEKKSNMIFERLLLFTKPNDFARAVVIFLKPLDPSEYWLNMNTKKICYDSMDTNTMDFFILKNGEYSVKLGYDKETKLENKLLDLYDYAKNIASHTVSYDSDSDSSVSTLEDD